MSLKQQQQQQTQRTTSIPKTTTTASAPKINLQDLSDDLGKVLMSKEEVITQLEKQLKDKEKHLQDLSEQLNEEIMQTNKLQETLNIELNRNSELNVQLKKLSNEKFLCSDQINSIKDELNKSTDMIQSLELNLETANSNKDKTELELKNLQEFSRNEMETLQEEIKTLEYKLVYSQRQAHEYQSILEDMDMSNTNSINLLSQTLSSCGGSFEYNDHMSNSNLQNRLKRNQSLVQLILQQIIQIKNSNIDELKEALSQAQNELDEVKEENNDLNAHIYSIDVFMREKEAQCDQYQKEKEDLVAQLAANNQNGTNSTTTKEAETSYELFLRDFKENLLQKTKNLSEFLKFILSVSQSLLKIDLDTEEDDESVLNEQKIFELINATSSSSSSTMINLTQFKKVLLSQADQNQSMFNNDLKLLLKKMVKLVNSSELAKFNNQIVSYMAEQLIHKAALNGHLKFACEIMRKKSSELLLDQAEPSTSSSSPSNSKKTRFLSRLTMSKTRKYLN